MTTGVDRRPRRFVRREIANFWSWYERNYALNVTVAVVLFGLQVVHLLWLGLDVVATRLGGTSLFPAGGVWLGLLVIVDLFEVPALVSVSLVYVNELRSKPALKPVVYLILLNSQWLHLLWITDEFVVENLARVGAWPVWLAWLAIGIDYLELPVMLDTLKRFLKALTGDGSVADAVGAKNEAPGASSGLEDEGDFQVSITQVEVEAEPPRSDEPAAADHVSGRG